MTVDATQMQAEAEDFFLNRIGRVLPDIRQRRSFATYGAGILGDSERKSVEPIAARAFADPVECTRAHQRLCKFLSDGNWDDRRVRLESARYIVDVLQEREPIEAWVIDDTGFLKKGEHSVGVARQYTGSAGKVTNCQVGVSLSITTRLEQVPIDFELYLPDSWIDDTSRRTKARIPPDAVFKTKTQLALEMIERAHAAGIPGNIVLADSAYGESIEFRETVRMLGFDYGVGIRSSTKLWLLDACDQPQGQALGVQRIGVNAGRKAFRKHSWREGTSGRKLSGRFCFRRVKVAGDDGSPLADREPLWLMIEWPEQEAKPTKFYLTTLPRRMSKKRIVCMIKERWKTERIYQEMKGHLGLDHFEGRSYTGWNHHLSVVLCCYAFTVAQQLRFFPPSAARQGRTGTDPASPGPPFRALLRDCSACDCAMPRHLDATSSHISTPPAMPS
jgi:SRSO17 transposase